MESASIEMQSNFSQWISAISLEAAFVNLFDSGWWNLKSIFASVWNEENMFGSSALRGGSFPSILFEFRTLSFGESQLAVWI